MEKKLLLLLLGWIVGISIGLAQVQDIHLDYACFREGKQEAVLEVFFSVASNDLILLRSSNGQYQGMLEVEASITQPNALRKVDTFFLLSAVFDSLPGLPLYLSAHRRFKLPYAQYELALEIKPQMPEIDPWRVTQTLDLRFPDSSICFSDILLLDKYKKVHGKGDFIRNGFELTPYGLKDYPESVRSLKAYTEIYNADKVLGAKVPFTVEYKIEEETTGKALTSFGRFSKHEAQSVNMLLTEVDIAKLPSGNYYFSIELHDQENNLLATQKKKFVRRVDTTAK